MGAWVVGRVSRDRPWRDKSYLLFRYADSFNRTSVSAWNVLAVRDMSHMFYGADSFNQDIEGVLL